MKKIITLLFLFEATLFPCQPCSADMLECIGPNGIVALTNTGCPEGFTLKRKIAEDNRSVRENSVAPQKENIPSWKSELNSFCEKAKNSDSLSEYDIQDEINRSYPLRVTLETLQTEPTYKMVNLKLYNNCKDLFILNQRTMQQRRDGDRILQSLRDKMDSLKK